jgi:deoxycytidylate deaminase
MNAILEVGRERVAGSRIYMTNFPCMFCAKAIVQAEAEALLYISGDMNEGVA